MRLLAGICRFIALGAALAIAPMALAQPSPPAAPVAGPGAPFPAADQPITRIAFGSCNGADAPIPILRQVAAADPDLFVYLGDNVYGDDEDPALPTLRAQYEALAANPDFQALRAVAPMLATWDDHDYGRNDAGADYPHREASERVFEAFWGSAARTGGYPGVYDAMQFGPRGERVQILLLDTRFDRSALATLPERGPRGRYAPQTAKDQRMLSEAQWRWLGRKLREPADIRIIASSVQVLADGHDYESWENFPLEQQRLYRTIRRARAKGVVFVSGDRHLAALYRDDRVLPYPAYELTASSLNRPFRGESDERSSTQLGDVYTPINFGLIEIDWSARLLKLSVRDEGGGAVRERAVPFSDLGLR